MEGWILIAIAALALLAVYLLTVAVVRAIEQLWTSSRDRRARRRQREVERELLLGPYAPLREIPVISILEVQRG